MIKRLAVMLCCAAFVCLCGDSQSRDIPVLRYHYEVRKDLSFYFTNADEVIEKIRSSLVNRDGDITINYTSHGDNMEDIASAVSELMQFALSETDRPNEGDYLDCCLGGYEVSYRYENSSDTYSYSVVITPIYYTDNEQESAVDSEVRRIISTLALDEKSGYEKIYSVYKYICDNVAYDKIHAKNDNYYPRSTAYGALVYKSATCQGYAAAVYRLLREAGLQCRVIKGQAYNKNTDSMEYHAWNSVMLDGEEYFLDATWDAGRQSFECFLKPEAKFGDHIPDDR